MSELKQKHPEFFKAVSGRDPVQTTFDEIFAAALAPATLETSFMRGKASNRKTAGLIALLGGLIFAASYATAGAGLMALLQNSDSFVANLLSFVTTPLYLVTSSVFTGLFVLVAVILTRASRLSFLLGSLLVAVLTYGAAVGAALLALPAWELSFTEAQTVLWNDIAFNPVILVAAVLGREIPLWLGVWISRRAIHLRYLSNPWGDAPR